MDDDHHINRRHVLKTAATSGAAVFAGSGAASADSESDRPWDDIETERVSEVLFAEIGFRFDADHSPDEYACHVTPYVIDGARSELISLSLTDAHVAKIERAAALVKRDGLHELPTTIERSEMMHAPLTTSETLAPEGSVRLEKPVRTPAVTVDRSGETVEVQVGGRSTSVEAGGVEEVPLDPVPLQTIPGSSRSPGRGGYEEREPVAIDASPRVIVNNYGTVDVKVADFEEVAL